MRYFIAFLTSLFFLLSKSLYSQKNFSFKIELIAKNVPESLNIFVAGNNEKLGFWQPNLIKMKKNNDSLWLFQNEFPENSIIEFKFSLGSWNTEAVNKENRTFSNFRCILKKDTVMKIKIFNWKNLTKKIENGIVWKAEYIKNLNYDGLLPRDIIILLPPSYEKNPHKRYPVLYMHDGQNIADPNTSAFGQDWRVDEVCDSLIKKGEIEEIIIVGIYNTADRYYEYSYLEKGKKYVDFIINKLKPLIDSNYRTFSDRENTAVMGSSMGGLISLIMGWEYSKYFSKAACLSPAIVYAKRQMDYTPVLKDKKFPEYSIKLYIDNGGLGIDSLLQFGVDKAIDILIKEREFKENENIFIFLDPKAEHNELAWSRRIYMPLKFFFGKKE